MNSLPLTVDRWSLSFAFTACTKVEDAVVAPGSRPFDLARRAENKFEGLYFSGHLERANRA